MLSFRWKRVSPPSVQPSRKDLVTKHPRNARILAFLRANAHGCRLEWFESWRVPLFKLRVHLDLVEWIAVALQDVPATARTAYYGQPVLVAPNFSVYMALCGTNHVLIRLDPTVAAGAEVHPFAEGGSDWFVMKAWEDLRTAAEIRLWHDRARAGVTS